MVKTFGALALFAAALALVFVRPSPPLPSMDVLTEPFDFAGFSTRLVKDGRWVEAHDVLSCALTFAPGVDRGALTRSLAPVRAKLVEADNLARSAVLVAEGQVFWEWVSLMAPEAVASRDVARAIGEKRGQADAPLPAVLRQRYGQAVASGGDPAVTLLLCLDALGGFSEGFAQILAQLLAPGEAVKAPASAVSGGSVEERLGETWKALWSVCRSSRRLGRAASILQHVNDMRDLRRAVIVCGMAPDGAQKMNAVVSVLRARSADGALGAECLYRVTRRRVEAAERMDELCRAVCRGPKAAKVVLRGVSLADLPESVAESVPGPVTRAANRLSARAGRNGFEVLKIIVIGLLSLPLAVRVSRSLEFSRRRSREMVRWSLVALVIGSALAVGLAARSGRSEPVDAEPVLTASEPIGQAAPAPSGSPYGWLWAAPLSILAILFQVFCAMKAKEKFRLIASATAEADWRAALRYVRFYAEAPVFIGFLGSVCGAILLQVLAAGQMIYFAYVSTASGLSVFLWIQHRYVLVAEGKTDPASARERETG